MKFELNEEQKEGIELIKELIIMGGICVIIWIVMLPWEIGKKMGEIRTNTTQRLKVLLTKNGA